MLKNGNTDPNRCLYNLIRTVRGEVPYERTKGINGALIDDPSALAKSKLKADALENIKIFEPRVSVDGLKIDAINEKSGCFGMKADVKGGA